MKRKGSSILFINDRRQVLLFLRDDRPDIAYPDMWDVPGGHVERDETPEQCIVREMKEEMGMDLKGFLLFCTREFDDRIEYTYWKKENLKLEKIHLTEGQRLRWFSEEEARNTSLAYGFNEIVADFFSDKRDSFQKGFSSRANGAQQT
ncbi:MAG: NUDIX hydrolase [Deltaproteobacteria bacterium HGW-Deltaproteobacteria-15]|jgi:8-oxo-dGTP diphosphatase|nr:MAG: NUDIX hydrolase [Deltaproteobacteria bacterium HGW-Deltaproteobacteria-15]